MKLRRHFVEKIWGRTDIAGRFGVPDGRRTGEIWYEGAPDDFGLLAKYLFTSERLSIQVHPDDAQAAARGQPSGKTECWYIVAAKPDATIGIGTLAPVSPPELRAAALSGAIEGLLDWRDVTAGDFYYVPPGTIHAIGPGVTMIEIQQAVDITYRLYDYGRPRELHLDDGVAVAHAAPFPGNQFIHVPLDRDAMLVDAAPFAVALAGSDLAGVPGCRQLLVVPLTGTIAVDDQTGGCGDCFHVTDIAQLEPSSDARMLVAWSHA
jgi:mannose-6-phosphate isomerase